MSSPNEDDGAVNDVIVQEPWRRPLPVHDEHEDDFRPEERRSSATSWQSTSTALRPEVRWEIMGAPGVSAVGR